jgi:hypothetical protein
MAKQEKSVLELVKMIEEGSLALPEMQRGYVWTKTRVRDLLDSLYRGYPSGVILCWQTRDDVARADFAVATNGSSFERPMLLLDGQQRLTSLSAILRGEKIQVRDRKRPIDILFNLDHPDGVGILTEVEEEGDAEEDEDDYGLDGEDNEDDLTERMKRRTFVVANKQLAALTNWVSVTEVMKQTDNAPFLRAAGVTSYDDPKFARYNERLTRLRGIRDYVYRLDVLEESLSYEEVTEIFVRVNSLGAKLRGSDLALAQITARWRGSLEIFQRFQKQCDRNGYELDLGFHVRALVAILTSQSRFRTVGSIPQNDLLSGWDRTTVAVERAINFMKANVGIESPVLLSSPLALVVLAYWFDRSGSAVDDAEARELHRWLLIANAKGHWSRGSSETLLDQDLATLRDGGGARQLLDRLAVQVGHLEVLPDDLAGRNSQSALFKAMFLAFAADGAQDWSTSVGISVKHAGKRDRLQFHHIFPKAYLKKHRSDLSRSQINDVANLAFIGGSTNRAISAKAPSDYLSVLAEDKPALLRAQQIPTDARLFEAERYLDFIDARRELIARRLSTFLGTAQ